MLMLHQLHCKSGCAEQVVICEQHGEGILGRPAYRKAPCHTYRAQKAICSVNQGMILE